MHVIVHTLTLKNSLQNSTEEVKATKDLDVRKLDTGVNEHAPLVEHCERKDADGAKGTAVGVEREDEHAAADHHL